MKQATMAVVAMMMAAAQLLLATGAPAEAWSYREAGAPHKGKTVRILDETTPIQEAMITLKGDFEKETGIKVEWELLNHFQVISKGEADLLSGQASYDLVMLHSPQIGRLLKAGVIRPIDDFMANAKLLNPQFDAKDLMQPLWDRLAKVDGKYIGFINWNYNQVYWTRSDLLGHPTEKAEFKKKYGYELAPAKTWEQVRDVAEFFTRKKGQLLAGKPLETDFYGIVLEGVKGGTTGWDVWNNYVRNWGGDLFDATGKPTFNRKENIEAVKFWAGLWKFSPPGQAEYSLIDIPTVMGNGIAAQTVAWSDFIFGIDRPDKSKLAGKFVYAGIPAKKGQEKSRSAETEPSLLVINKASKNAEAAFLYMQWLAENKTQEKWLATGAGAIPVRESGWSHSAVTGRWKPLYTAMRESLKYGGPKPRVPEIYQINDVLVAVLQEIALGKKSADEGLAAAQRDVEKICTQCFLK
jgi:multiple sugar transport system substrate-binding protein